MASSTPTPTSDEIYGALQTLLAAPDTAFAEQRIQTALHEIKARWIPHPSKRRFTRPGDSRSRRKKRRGHQEDPDAGVVLIPIDRLEPVVDDEFKAESDCARFSLSTRREDSIPLTQRLSQFIEEIHEERALLRKHIPNIYKDVEDATEASKKGFLFLFYAQTNAPECVPAKAYYARMLHLLCRAYTKQHTQKDFIDKHFDPAQYNSVLATIQLGAKVHHLERQHRGLGVLCVYFKTHLLLDWGFIDEFSRIAMQDITIRNIIHECPDGWTKFAKLNCDIVVEQIKWKDYDPKGNKSPWGTDQISKTRPLQPTQHTELVEHHVAVEPEQLPSELSQQTFDAQQSFNIEGCMSDHQYTFNQGLLEEIIEDYPQPTHAQDYRIFSEGYLDQCFEQMFQYPDTFSQGMLEYVMPEHDDVVRNPNQFYNVQSRDCVEEISIS